MNAIDLIVCLTVLVAVWNGWRLGFIVQVCSLAGLVAAVWLASRFGAQAGELLRLDPEFAAPGGFVAVLVVVVIAVAILARVARKLFHFAGFGLPDHLLGVAVSVLKYLLLLGVLFSAFGRLNRDFTLVEPSTIETSKSYTPLVKFSEGLLPFLDRIGESIPDRIKNTPQEPSESQKAETPAPDAPQTEL